MIRIVTIAAALALSSQAHASAQVASAPNCDVLNTGTFVCVHDDTKSSITKITCTGGWGSTDLNISHGAIKPGGTTVVDFGSCRCNKHITVFTKDGHQYQFDGFDTTSNTSLIVSDGD